MKSPAPRRSRNETKPVPDPIRENKADFFFLKINKADLKKETRSHVCLEKADFLMSVLIKMHVLRPLLAAASEVDKGHRLVG